MPDVEAAEAVNVVNYSAHAIDDFRRIAEGTRSTAPHFARTFSRLADTLDKSVKFLLPNCCELLDPAVIGQGHLDLLRLPYPYVALEAPWYRGNTVQQYGDVRKELVTKRIALCWEAGIEGGPVDGLNSILKTEKYRHGGIFVLPIYKAETQPIWTPLHGGVFVPYENKVVPGFPEIYAEASKIAYDQRKEAGLVERWSKSWTVEPFVLMPDSWQDLVQRLGDKQRVLASIIDDSHDEVLMAVQTCAVLNCSNVRTAEVAPTAKLNRSRMRTGKTPFFTYKVLTVETDPSPKAQGNAQGGAHASPRMHLRRGHLRRVSERVVWVRPAMVGAHGLVEKDYRIRRT